MKHIKNLLVVVLMFSLVLSLAACSGESASEESEETSKSEEAVVVPEGEPVIVLEGYGTAAFGPMESTINLYEGDKLTFTTLYANRETVFDGTWSISDDEATITININEREETTTWEAKKGGDGFYTFDYTTFDGKGEAVVSYTSDVK